MDSKAKDAEADALEAQANKLRNEAADLRQAELLATPLLQRMVFAATARCDCGAGMAYDPASQGKGVFKGPSAWECSDILRYAELVPEQKVAAKAATHTGALPFAFYEVKSENTSSANGQTTRPAVDAA